MCFLCSQLTKYNNSPSINSINGINFNKVSLNPVKPLVVQFPTSWNLTCDSESIWLWDYSGIAARLRILSTGDWLDINSVVIIKIYPSWVSSLSSFCYGNFVGLLSMISVFNYSQWEFACHCVWISAKVGPRCQNLMAINILRFSWKEVRIQLWKKIAGHQEPINFIRRSQLLLLTTLKKGKIILYISHCSPKRNSSATSLKYE